MSVLRNIMKGPFFAQRVVKDVGKWSAGLKKKITFYLELVD
jgi:hypothetical protein